jgi:hypothetical protein
MKTYGEEDAQLHSFLTSALEKSGQIQLNVNIIYKL